jgi:IS30 family transposase
MPKYRRVTYTHRCQIHALLQTGFNQREIAEVVGLSKSTICRELKRNRVSNLYIPQTAQAFANRRKRRCRRKSKIDQTQAKIIKEKLTLTWSPEQISGRFRLEKGTYPSTPALYRYIKKDDSFRCHLRWYKRRGAGRYLQRRARPKWESSIESRPLIANERGRIGDWERDTMHAKGGMALICTDRKSRFTLIEKVEKRTANGIAFQTQTMIQGTGRRSYTMTNDNGPEFRGSIQVGVPIYYCRPMRPQQRGTVENTIGTIRRFIPKNRDLKKMKRREISKIEELLNNKPRKCLDFRTPHEVYYGKLLHSQR